MNTANCDLFTRLIRTRPLLLAAVLYLVGCIAAYTMHIPVEIECAGIAVFLILAALLRNHRRRIAAAMLLLAFIPLGAVRFDAAWNANSPLPEQKKAVLSGRICQTPVWNAETERTICVLDDFSIDGSAQRGKIRLYLRGDTELLQLMQLGQQLQCEAHIWEADGASNPGQFNFSNYLRINGLRGYATAKIEETRFSEPSYRFSDWPERICSVIGGRIAALFPENARLARAFLLGDRSELSEDERTSYSVSGAAHLLAISGMHVSVLASFLSLLFSRILGRKKAFWVTVFCLLLYGALIGYSASLFRAILIFIIFSAAPLAGRYSDAPTRLGAAMLLYLLFFPLAILSSSFVLSYCASAGIIFLYPSLTRLFRADEYLRKHTDVGFVSLFTKRLPRFCLQTLLFTLAAQLATLPAAVHYFGTQPVWSILVNLIAIPLAMYAYILAIIAVCTGFPPLGLLSDFLFSLLSDCVRFFGNLPFTAIGIARFPAWLVLICAICFIGASELSRLPEKLRRFLPLAVLPAILISNICSYSTSSETSIVFLDAGEADCAVIRSDHHIYLVDTGDDYSPAADYLSAMNYHVDGIFLSHPHADHCGGLMDILAVDIPDTIYISENWDNLEKDEGVSEAIAEASARGAEIVRLHSGDSISLSDKTLLEVLSPTAGFPANSANEDSMMLRISHGSCSAVFTGDMPAELAAGRVGDTDILKIAHHGANDSLNAALLMETSPSVAVIPVGYNNYGHPTDKTLKLLRAASVETFRTDLHGAITCRMNADGSVDAYPYQTSEAVNGF